MDIIKPTITSEKIKDNIGTFTIEPLERGFGYTLGNSLRRVLISSVPGAAITWVRFDGVSHEFATIKGVREDVTEIILNIKNLVFSMDDSEPQIIKLEVKGPKDVYGSDLKLPAGVSVINEEQHIATLNSKGSISAEFQVEKGNGYVSADRNKKVQQPLGTIPIDSIFTPTRNVSLEIENTRVGQRTDYDKLILNIETDGSISPKEAASIAAKIIDEHMSLFITSLTEEAISVFSTEQEPKDQSLNVPVEQIDLSVRAYNCLKRAEINTLYELINCTEKDLLSMRNFGAKSINEIKEKLAQLELSLKDSKDSL